MLLLGTSHHGANEHFRSYENLRRNGKAVYIPIQQTIKALINNGATEQALQIQSCISFPPSPLNKLLAMRPKDSPTAAVPFAASVRSVSPITLFTLPPLRSQESSEKCSGNLGRRKTSMVDCDHSLGKLSADLRLTTSFSRNGDRNCELSITLQELPHMLHLTCLGYSHQLCGYEIPLVPH